MRAVILKAPGAAPNVEALPDPPPPRDGEVLVAMLRAPINPADRLMIAGAYSATLSTPAILGAEGVGVVLETGADVGDLKIGDYVIPLSRGNWATRRLLRADDLIRVPSDLPLDQAATLRVNPATAWRLLHLAPLAAGACVIQNAANSSVAHWVRTLAATLDVRVLDVVRREVAELPNAIVAHPGEILANQIAARHPNARATLALDAVAGAASGVLAACLESGGELVVFGHLSGDPCVIPSTLLTAKQLVVRGFSLRPAEASQSHAQMQALYDRLAPIVRQAPSSAPTTYTLNDLGAALAAAGSQRIMLDLAA